MTVLAILLVIAMKVLQTSLQLPTRIPPLILPPTKKIIHIGALFVSNDTRYTPWVGYEGSAGALLVAIDRVREMHLLDDFEFNITVKFDNCIEKDAVGLAFELISQYNVDIIFGPTCNVPAIAVGVMASYYNLPHYIWGFTTANELALSLAILSVMRHFNWNEFAFIHTPSEDPQKCPIFLTDIQKAVYANPDFTISYQGQFRNPTIDEITQTLLEVKSKARIIVLCLSLPQNKRSFMLRASEQNMLGDDYVYIFADLGTRGYSKLLKYKIKFVLLYSGCFLGIGSQNNRTTYVWEDQSNIPDGLDTKAFNAFDKAFILSDIAEDKDTSRAYEEFALKVNSKIMESPFFCGDACNKSSGWKLAESASQLYDAFLIWANMANKSLTENVSYRDGAWMFNRTAGTYEGLLNNVTIAWDGARIPNFSFSGLDSNMESQILGLILMDNRGENATFIPQYNVQNEDSIVWNGRKRPMAVPITSQSFVSHASDLKVIEGKSETANMCYFYYAKDALMGLKHKVALKYEQHVNEEFRRMRQIEHDNLNRFFGITVDADFTYSLWRFCSRGTLQDVITKGSLPMDSVFIHSMMMDIASGLIYIHDSFLGFHGRLTSQVCMVDDRWQVKISYYGLTYIKDFEHRSNEELLWTAPEILRGEADIKGTPEGDVYSFAIIASELVTKRTAWDLDNRKENIEDIIRIVKKTTMDPFRPDIETTDNMDIVPSLVRFCYS
uniref:guanylate cyclase n=1 Tax=Heterorhabditis bacteriophora TaxID=37862 RepID=A0A1I7XIH6_HETBA